MEKRKYKPTPKSKKERIGVSTGLLDCNRDEILTGTVIRIKNTEYQGPVMWNRHQDCYGVYLDYSLRSRNHDANDPDNYGKFIKVPSDNGMRMELVPVPV